MLNLEEEIHSIFVYYYRYLYIIIADLFLKLYIQILFVNCRFEEIVVFQLNNFSYFRVRKAHWTVFKYLYGVVYYKIIKIK